MTLPRTQTSLALVLFLVSACGSSSKDATIAIVAPEKGAQLTLKDDLDRDKAGLQYDVRATASGVATGTPVLLTVEGETDAALGSVAKDGSILFDNVTLPPGQHILQVSTGAGTVKSADSHDYTFKTLIIDSPRDGAALGFSDDKDSSLAGVQISVTASVYAIATGEDIVLRIDGTSVGKPAHADTKGKVLFTGVTLPMGSHTLQAIAGTVESNSVRLSVNEGCATVRFVSPKAPADGNRLVVGGGNSCPTGDADFVMDVVVSTDAGEGRDVELKVNGATVRSTKVAGALATFPDVVLNHRTTANQLSVIVQGVQGVTCNEVPYSADIFVDCDGSDCAIASPDPVAGPDAAQGRALYLNRSKLAAKGFDIRVDTDIGAVSNNVQLIIDRNDRNALKALPKEADSQVTARFGGVVLSEGAHTVEARCEDAAGNVTYSGESSWIVDTQACTIAVNEPSSDVLYVAADDVDANTGGVQVELRSSVGGNDCSFTRTDVCDPAVGINDASFEPYDGNSSLVSRATLHDASQQTLCVEVKDRASNLARDSIDVGYREGAPKVQIESPTTGDSFNVTGNDGHKADSDPSTPTVCNANFDILCSELDSPVELRRGSSSGALLATAACVAASGGDALPSGFAGRVHFANVAFLSSGATAGTVVALQKVASSSNTPLVGTSSVELSGLCQAPRLDFSLGCPASQMELQGATDLSLASLQAVYSGNVGAAPPDASLTVTGSVTGSLGSSSSPFTIDRYRFLNVNLGHTAETVTTQVTATDTFGNLGSVSCMTTLVTDLPALVVSSPADGRLFGPGQGCSPSVAGKYGIPVQITLDQVADRELTYTVGSGDSVPATVSGTSMSLCLPAEEGPNAIGLRLGSTTSVGYAAVSFTAVVRSVALALPPNGSTLVAADDYCDPGFGAHVQATADPIHTGATATISNGTTTTTATVASGGNIETCLQLNQGANTITVSIDGSTASVHANVTVVGAPPTTAVQIVTVTLPAGNQYRTGKVHLAWSAPTQDWPNQLQAYSLRCAGTAIHASDSDAAKNAWWAAAESVPLPINFPISSLAMDVAFRIGEARECVLRARDSAQQFTPIPDSKKIGYAFREQPVDVSDINKMGIAIVRVGDVSGDDVDDILVGGAGRAYLYFGSAQGLASKPHPAEPDVTFIGNVGQNTLEFGSRVVGIGDFNGDGRNDFVIGFPGYTGAGDRTGAAYLFYGRTVADPWPSTVDDAAGCQADVCFVGEQALEFLSFAMAPAGDFDADGRADLVLCATARDVPGDTLGGRAYVLLGHTFEASGARPGGFWGTQVRVPSDDPVGFYIDGTGPVLVAGVVNDAASSSQFGQAAASVGNIDGAIGADLLLSAAGKGSGSPITAKLFFLSGRMHDGLAPKLRSIPHSELQTKGTGQANRFASALAPLTNFRDGSESGVPDVAVAQAAQNDFYVYLGDQNASSVRFASDTRVTIQGEVGSQLGASIASSYNAGLAGPAVGDLDGDELDELLVGTRQAANMPAVAGVAYLFYGDVTASSITSQTLSYTTGSEVDPAPRSGALRRTVQLVGDVTGDGHPDMVIADADANSGTGGFTVLY